jgi:hypothetical protein
MVPENCIDGPCFTDERSADERLHAPVQHEELCEIANRLVRFPQICEVYIFGDSLYGDSAPEANLLLIVNKESDYKKFLKAFRETVETLECGNINESVYRKLAVWKVLGEKAFLNFLSGLDEDTPHNELSLLLNLYILPRTWRERLEEIQVVLSPFESNFMERLNQEARIFARAPKS